MEITTLKQLNLMLDCYYKLGHFTSIYELSQSLADEHELLPVSVHSIFIFNSVAIRRQREIRF